jgi:CheY-like chemotaxis protein
LIDALRRDAATEAIPVVLTPAPSVASVWPKPIHQSALVERIAALVPEGQERARVLVVDDDPHVAEIVRALVEPSGYRVVAAASGKRGLELARASPPDVAVVDLVMPDMSGFDVVDALHEDARTRSVPIIVLTAADVTDEERARLKLRVKALAEKGNLTRDELVAAVDRATGRASLRTRIAAAVGPTILVVDDNDVNRELLRSMLERLGHRVIVAADGEEAVRVTRRELPALVLMDLAMPKKDGYTASRELKADPATADIPIVAVTALAMRGDEEKAYAAGIDGYLTKPIHRKTLEEIVDRFLNPGEQA